ncbi:MAG: response regulator [Gammaproteobacteria bacterium]|nr:response regulator [Gammaproteobacteria bacterium]
MVVDDEENILKSITRVLNDLVDVEVECFTKPTEALRRAKTSVYDLFISDFRMPGIDGISFLVSTKNLQPNSVRIILSGQADETVLADSINEAEIFRFILKPWNNTELLKSVTQALQHKDILYENKILSDKVRSLSVPSWCK